MSRTLNVPNHDSDQVVNQPWLPQPEETLLLAVQLSLQSGLLLCLIGGLLRNAALYGRGHREVRARSAVLLLYADPSLVVHLNSR